MIFINSFLFQQIRAQVDISLEYRLWNKIIVSLSYRSILGICNRCEDETLFLLRDVMMSLTLADSGAQVFLCPGCWSSAWCPGGLGVFSQADACSCCFPIWRQWVWACIPEIHSCRHREHWHGWLQGWLWTGHSLSLTIPKYGTTRTHSKHKYR